MQRLIRAALVSLGVASAAHAADNGWSAYGADAGGTRYSTAKQVTRANVGSLRVAWSYRTHALDPPSGRDDDKAAQWLPFSLNGHRVALHLIPSTGDVIASSCTMAGDARCSPRHRRLDERRPRPRREGH